MRIGLRWSVPAATVAALLLAGCTGDATDRSDAPVPAPPTPPPSSAAPTPFAPELDSYDVPPGSRPHDVAPAADGGVWYTAQGSGELGHLDPATGDTRHIPLGPGSRPHGVIVGPDGAAWVTDGGQNAIVRVDPATERVEVLPLPADRPEANLNTAAFDRTGRLWFTGQSGVYGRLDPATGDLAVFDAPRGRGPYGITATPDGEIYFVSLAGSYLAHVDLDTDQATVIEPPTPGQGARRVWSDSAGQLWVSEWNTGQVSRYDPATDRWREWPLPGDNPRAYAVYVDERDAVWLTDFGGNAIWRFDPSTERFREFGEACEPNRTRCPKPGNPGEVRQLLGREGELWAPESATDRLVVIRY
ncbi:MAG: virginiamycin B lyase family protein [Natronosporangium sp.]